MIWIVKKFRRSTSGFFVDQSFFAILPFYLPLSGDFFINRPYMH
jgi:hypothetical protein